MLDISALTTPAGHRAVRTLRIKDDHLARVLAGEEFLLFDGAMGTQLQERGLAAGEVPELLCLTNPDEITQIHAAYVAAGSEAVTTNTFGANATKLGENATVEEIFTAAVGCARASGARYVAADIGPTGALLQPMGTLPFEDAYQLFAQQVKAADAAGADLFIIETMADIAEAKAALLAVKEHSDLPAFVTMTFDEDGRTFLGTTPEVAAVTLCALGADVLGINCSLGPADVAPLIERMLPWASCPVMAQANAGLPHVHEGRTYYSIKPLEYGQAVRRMVRAGVSVIGGCCGTSPEFIAQEKNLLVDRTPAGRSLNSHFTVTSAQQLVALAMGEVGVIGERINPTGKKRLKEALRTGNHDYVLSEAISQTEAGAQILDVNAGLPEIDEAATLVRLASELSGVTTLPLQIDSSDPVAIERAVRSYPGKALINSCNGKREVLEAVLPIAKHYGCAIVCLTLDEDGIPPTAEGRLAVARKIVAATDAIGIPRQDVVIDCLAMAASTDQTQPRQIVDAIRMVKAELEGVRTVLGVSNISFGMPFRPLVNATFLAACFGAGLDLAIVNPMNERLMDVVRSWRALSGEDESAQDYIARYADRKDGAAASATGPASYDLSSPGGVSAALSSMASTLQAIAAGTGGLPTQAPDAQAAAAPGQDGSCEGRIRDLVLTGRKEAVADEVRALLDDGDPSHDVMYAINQVLIPALDEVGDRFERGTFFLPQLMASAEAAKAGFTVLRESSAEGGAMASKGQIVLATVKGDIHDIGKNIVRMLLENYGYDVMDLGRDVDPQAVADAVVEHHVTLAGLSALMTTTVPAMAETIQLLHVQAPWCKVMVGGAVLNPEYAQMVGADFYAKDAAESARIAAEVLG